jgi:hypothetical protein
MGKEGGGGGVGAGKFLGERYYNGEKEGGWITLKSISESRRGGGRGRHSVGGSAVWGGRGRGRGVGSAGRSVFRRARPGGRRWGGGVVGRRGGGGRREIEWRE